MGSEHKYKFFDLAIFFHLSFETVNHELAVEFAHGASNKLIRVSGEGKLFELTRGRVNVDSRRTQDPFPLLCPAISARGLSRVSLGIWYS